MAQTGPTGPKVWLLVTIGVVFLAFSVFVALLVLHDHDVRWSVRAALVVGGAAVGLAGAALVLRRRSAEQRAEDFANRRRVSPWAFGGIGCVAAAISVPDGVLVGGLIAMEAFAVTVLTIAVADAVTRSRTARPR